jgi:hypothetical protein
MEIVVVVVGGRVCGGGLATVTSRGVDEEGKVKCCSDVGVTWQKDRKHSKFQLSGIASLGFGCAK